MIVSDFHYMIIGIGIMVAGSVGIILQERSQIRPQICWDVISFNESGNVMDEHWGKIPKSIATRSAQKLTVTEIEILLVIPEELTAI